jgi:hypothetical protein
MSISASELTAPLPMTEQAALEWAAERLGVDPSAMQVVSTKISVDWELAIRPEARAKTSRPRIRWTREQRHEGPSEDSLTEKIAMHDYSRKMIAGKTLRRVKMSQESI